jgi:hypothetical protein
MAESSRLMKSESESAIPWAQVFSRTADLPLVFTVRRSYYSEVNALIESLDLNEHHKGGLFSTWYWATPLIDGYVLTNLTYGFPSGSLPTGMRVVGANPLRLICHLLGLTQPRKFASEKSVPKVETLVAKLEEQQSHGIETLESGSHDFLFAETTSDLVALSFKLFGEEGLPREMAGYEHLIPAPGEWGENGFMLHDYKLLVETGIPLSEALKWSDLVRPVWRFVEIIKAGVTFNEVMEWHKEGVEPHCVPGLKEVGASFNEVREWMTVGGFAGNYASLKKTGVSVADVKPYMEMGFSDPWAMNLLTHKVSVSLLRELIEEMKPKQWGMQIVMRLAISGMDRATLHRWMQIGIRPEIIDIAVSKSIAIELVEAYTRTPKSPQQIEQFIRKQ